MYFGLSIVNGFLVHLVQTIFFFDKKKISVRLKTSIFAECYFRIKVQRHFYHTKLGILLLTVFCTALSEYWDSFFGVGVSI